LFNGGDKALNNVDGSGGLVAPHTPFKNSNTFLLYYAV